MGSIVTFAAALAACAAIAVPTSSTAWETNYLEEMVYAAVEGDYESGEAAAAARNENITVIFVNNAIYGMTGGQMAPTSLPGQITQTSPYGRDVNTVGYPVKVCEMLSQIDGATYLERVAVNNIKNIKAAKAAIKKAFQNQVEGKGFSLVEVLSTCPTNWGKSPVDALAWLEENMIPYYPLGVYKDKTKEEK